MSSAATMIEQRRHSRVQLHLAVRLRWLGPLGTRLEICQTSNVARTGLLFYRPEECVEGARVWVTFPFDFAAPEPQQEIAARVVRMRKTPAGGYLVAIQFDDRPFVMPLVTERRTSKRTPIVVPVSVRSAHAPWSEEAMTLDVSASGLRFETSRMHQPGERVHIRLRFDRWADRGELAARAVRVEPVAEAAEQEVAVAWENPATEAQIPIESKKAKT
jgi:PilZ domain